MSVTKGCKKVLTEKVHEKKKSIMKEFIEDLREDVKKVQECVKKKKIAS